MKLSILVTGCGGDIGQSIGKILIESDFVNYLVGCDISEKNAGKFIFKDFIIGLACTDTNYLKSLEDIIFDKEIDIIIPIAEPELRFLYQESVLDKIANAKIICANKKALKIGFDKLETALFLKENKLPFPETKLLSDVNTSIDYPVIMKSRYGSGSSSVYIVKDQIDFDYLKCKHPDYIVQEYLTSKEGEYTCGVFRSKAGMIRSIILKRELTGGYSGYGEVVHNDEITNVLNQIATKLNLTGSINIQLRITSKGPVVFEINPRFSSTVLFRHKFGFKDLIWSIQDQLNQDISSYNEINVGKRFYKGFSEFIDV
ncbi:MAG: ATP-grasp domain-containing protein [Flavobacteriaceae bacterium]